jgi:hypothetical protein
MELYEQVCRWCQAGFVICKACFRGQRYCSAPCRQESRRKQLEQARERYEHGSRGRQSNRARQCRYRIRRCLEELAGERAGREKVTDRSSPAPAPALKLPAEPRQPVPEVACAFPDVLARRPRERAVRQGRCQCCGSTGVVVRVPAGWLRRRHRFVPPPLGGAG